jgi:hypothetical protein
LAFTGCKKRNLKLENFLITNESTWTCELLACVIPRVKEKRDYM